MYAFDHVVADILVSVTGFMVQLSVSRLSLQGPPSDARALVTLCDLIFALLVKAVRCSESGRAFHPDNCHHGALLRGRPLVTD